MKRRAQAATLAAVVSRARLAGWVDNSTWLFVLLVVLTLVPSACVLWFMNEAVTIETSTARQQVLEAYRGQLRLVRSRLDGVWNAQAGKLRSDGPPAQAFAALITTEVADGAVVLNADGTVAFPRGQAERSGTREKLAGDVAERLNDYTTEVDAPTRLLLMDQLRERAPNVWLPTQAALRLSLEFVATERPAPLPGVVRQTALHDIWALTSSDGRAIGLYRTGRLEALMHDFLHEISPAGVVFIAYPPDVPADAEAVAAGPWLPGWQLSFVPLQRDRSAVGRRRTVYLSVALAGVALIVIVGGVASGGLRRHLRLARLKTDLVAAASHELRTPLTSMRVLVDGLLADTSPDPVKTREYLQLLATENARLSRVIENFLTFSKLDRGRHQFNLQPVDAAAIVDSAVQAIRDRVPSSCAIQVEVPEGVPPVAADREALSTALVNLLDNAVKFTPDEKRLAIRVRADGDRSVSFAVSDNGIGIAPRERTRIFRRFYQVDRRLSRGTGGVGLGLSIVELIVRGHHGRLRVESEIGKGSTFIIDVPVATKGHVA